MIIIVVPTAIWWKWYRKCPTDSHIILYMGKGGYIRLVLSMSNLHPPSRYRRQVQVYSSTYGDGDPTLSDAAGTPSPSQRVQVSMMQ